MSVLIPEKRIGDIINLSRRAYSDYKLHILALTGFGFLSGILEGVGINAIIPLFSFLTGEKAEGVNWLSEKMESLFGFFSIPFSLKYLLIFIALLFLLKVPLTIFLTFLRTKIKADYEEKTKVRVFSASVNSKWPFLLKQKSGHLENMLLIDVSGAGAMLSHIGAVIMVITNLIIYLLVAVNISAIITFSALVLGAFIFIVSKPLFNKVRSLTSKRVQVSKEIAHTVSENIFGIKSLKTSLALDGVLLKARDLFHKITNLDLKFSILKDLSNSFMQPVAVFFIIFLLGVSYKFKLFSIASVVVIVYLIEKIFIYLEQLLRTAHTLNGFVPNLLSVLTYEEEALKNKEADDNLGKDFNFKNSLEFRDVSFGYDGGRNILSKINLSIKKGEALGVIGPSGAGKTTLVDLFLRLLRPKSGKILLDDIDIFEIKLRQWRKNIGYVAQDIFLMHDTIANNIKFYNDSITQEDMVTAAKMADIYDFIAKLPNKFESIIGERGLMLSAGQRQRIVLARILATKPKILILDEATSALDNESEKRIQKVIINLKGKITVIAIAHRLSTVMNSDRLVVLKEGKIVEQDRPETLFKDKSSYLFKMYNIHK